MLLTAGAALWTLGAAIQADALSTLPDETVAHKKQWQEMFVLLQGAGLLALFIAVVSFVRFFLWTGPPVTSSDDTAVLTDDSPPQLVPFTAVVAVSPLPVVKTELSPVALATGSPVRGRGRTWVEPASPGASPGTSRATSPVGRGGAPSYSLRARRATASYGTTTAPDLVSPKRAATSKRTAVVSPRRVETPHKTAVPTEPRTLRPRRANPA